jgi:translocation and assembly module TamA
MRKTGKLLTFCLFLCCSAQIFAAPSLKNVITGIKEKAALKNAQARLKINQEHNNEALTKSEIKEYYSEGVKNIKAAIAPYGYFASSVKPSLSNKGEKWTATYKVDPGPKLKVTVSNIRITGPGNSNKYMTEAFSKLPLKTGAVFSTHNYDKTKDLLIDTAHAAGFIDAKYISDKITINPAAYTCVVDLTLQTGKRYYFGNVTFSPSPISDSLLKRYIPFKIGSPYSTNQLTNFQQLLSQSGYFASVAADPDKANTKDQKIPINVKLKKSKQKFYRFGVGYGTGTGARILAGINWRWVNKYGQKFSLNTMISQVSSALSAQYLFPGSNPSTDQRTITATRFTLNPYRTQESIGNRLSLADTFKLWDIQQNYQVDFLAEKYRFAKSSGYLRAHAVIPGFTWRYTSAKNILKITQGSMISMNWRGATTSFLSSVRFLQTQWKYKWVHPLFSKNLRLVLDGQLGYTFINSDSITKLPLSLQFYAGGIYTMRGYNYNSLGPGRYLVLGSAEVQRRIVGDLWVGVFDDEGNVFNFFPVNYQRGVGASLIYQTPVGPLAISIAQAQTKKGRPLKFQFSIGPEL